MKITTIFHAKSRAAWRRWLQQNHDAATEIWVVYDKTRDGMRPLPYADAVEEALCFGWIDGIVKPFGEHQYAQRFTPRKKSNSNWSAVNRERFARLERTGLMTAAGRVVGPHLAKPLPKRWSADQPLPEFVNRGIKGKARKNFDAMARSYREQFVRWIIDAKQEETRKRRLALANEKLERNERRFP